MRLFDLAASLVGLILLSPVLLLVAVFIKLDSAGPVLYRAQRVGQEGRPFLLFKFRTMVSRADQKGPAITVADDQRVTRVGRLLRRTKLDELPQFINVVRGDMCLVGPRPEDPRYVALYTPEQRRVLTARPGITSQASIRYCHEEELLSGADWEQVYVEQVMQHKLQIELDYMDRRTVATDLSVLLQTALVLFLPDGILRRRPSHAAQTDRSEIFRMLSVRNRYFFLMDLMLLPATAVLAFVLRLDMTVLGTYAPAVLLFAALSVPVKLITFYLMGMYRRFWHYASVDELLLVVTATGISELVVMGLLFFMALPLAGIQGFPRSIPFIDGLLTVLVVGAPRFAVRLVAQRRVRERRRGHRRQQRRVLVMGAGSAGAMIVKEMRANPQLGLVPIGLMDDDRRKHGSQIHGVEVLGDREQIPGLIQQYQVDEVIIAMPTAPGSTIREILGICNKAGIPARTIPGLYDILSGQVSIKQIREVDIEDLLRRDIVKTDTSVVEEMLADCRVMVTGAGGSIGSELCRQIARCKPKTLILVGHGETSIFAVAGELRRIWPRLTVEQVIADVRDLDRLQQVLDMHRPEIIFHAAAHKHVPLMEGNVTEAVTNNVLGTANLLQLSEMHHVGRFVFVSTDKAVNPSSVMGATKRVAELLVQSSAQRSGRPYVAVRFGNVLDSRGSVVPVFREQIAWGGPVTITHPEVRRYFMTIPEAVELVLQASSLGEEGEIFVLDMGEPIRIVDLAQDLIQLSGLEVGRDIEVEYTGLRPGEKLFEDVVLAGEEFVPTRHEKIFALRNGSQISSFIMNLEEKVQELVSLAHRGDEHHIRVMLKEIVPEYAPVPAESLDLQEGS
ncbi:MAG TPA: polysaccharide biosynthesis protein [Anaerolineae bacterium]|nr:polysaccharide biosynthesis protein [Anaerolineae bacterium]